MLTSVRRWTHTDDDASLAVLRVVEEFSLLERIQHGRPVLGLDGQPGDVLLEAAPGVLHLLRALRAAATICA